MSDEEVEEVVPLSAGDFQTADFVNDYPIPDFPGEEALWESGPKSSWGYFWKPDSWAWAFRNMFTADFAEKSCDPAFVEKGKACARGSVKLPVNPQKSSLTATCLSRLWILAKRPSAAFRTLAFPSISAKTPGRR